MPSMLWEPVAALQGLLNTTTARHCSPALQPELHTLAGRGSRPSLFSHLLHIFMYIWMDLGLWERAGICKCTHMPPAGMQGWDMVGTHRHAGVGLILGLEWHLTAGLVLERSFFMDVCLERGCLSGHSLLPAAMPLEEPRQGLVCHIATPARRLLSVLGLTPPVFPCSVQTWSGC